MKALALLAIVAAGAVVRWLWPTRTGINQREWSRAVERVRFNQSSQE